MKFYPFTLIYGLHARGKTYAREKTENLWIAPNQSNHYENMNGAMHSS